MFFLGDRGFFPRPGDAAAHFRRALGRRWQAEVHRSDGRRLVEKVDPVKKRPRNPGLIVLRAAGSARTGGGAGPSPTAAGVHRRDQLEARRIAHMPVGPRDDRFARFERLAQAVENLP